MAVFSELASPWMSTRITLASFAQPLDLGQPQAEGVVDGRRS